VQVSRREADVHLLPEGGFPGPIKDETFRQPPRDAVAPSENGKRVQGGEKRHRALHSVLSPFGPILPSPVQSLPEAPHPQTILSNTQSWVLVFQSNIQMHPILASGLPQAGETEPYPLKMIVEGDPCVRKTSFRIPKPPLKIGDPVSASSRLLTEVSEQAETERHHGLQEVREERHGQFGRCRGGRGAEIRGKVGNREVRFMADGRNDGDP
jgi:hypothetical protein